MAKITLKALSLCFETVPPGPASMYAPPRRLNC
jgi:hypothetical protein